MFHAPPENIDTDLGKKAFRKIAVPAIDIE